MPSGLDKLTNLQILSKYVLMKSEKCIPRHGGELKELMRLNNLRGKLEVINLSCEKNVAVEYEKAKLKDKQYLRSLTLEWDSEAKMDETEAISGYEMSLEGLQPQQNIQNLKLRNYGGVKLSTWLSSLTNLVELTLKGCAKFEYLVPLNQFKCLKHLILDNLGWWRETDNHISLPYYLPSLSKLEIRNCPKLTCMPLYPRLEGKLLLNKTTLKPLEETLRMRMMMSSNDGSVFPTAPSFSPLSKLECLYLIDIDDLECLPDSFKGLTCLSSLIIGGCPKLKDLCPGILHLSSLRHLQISKCEWLGDMLISDDYDFMWQSLNGTLQSLQLRKLPNIKTVLPKGIQHLTSLQQLQVESCDDLTTIPEWIHNLKSLKCLELSDCPNLTSFPEGIRSLTTLNVLHIFKCPILLKRCKRNTGEDWDKISHIRLDLRPDPNKEEENETDRLLFCNYKYSDFAGELIMKKQEMLLSYAVLQTSLLLCEESEMHMFKRVPLCPPQRFGDSFASYKSICFGNRDFDLACVSRKVFEDVLEFTRIRDKPDPNEEEENEVETSIIQRDATSSTSLGTAIQEIMDSEGARESEEEKEAKYKGMQGYSGGCAIERVTVSTGSTRA
ncbi:hypothetical protein G4B88_029551 [Cannabis sativa]|uniref:Uncharacterized protein n=1 Tax=Cannabis sativa TaxID=3483 RepID=A0A7J6E8F5_CANSA|nr:hypothetical protein G4B88_029551 [Cannabis sativa]